MSTPFTPDPTVQISQWAQQWAIANGWTPPAAVPAAAPLPAPAPVAPLGYKTLAFEDTFPGTTISKTWELTEWYVKPKAPGSIADHGGGVADPAQVHVDNGLTLTAVQGTPWLCGWVDTAPDWVTPRPPYLVEFSGVELPPSAPGLWPAICMYAGGPLAPGVTYCEFDLVEAVGVPQTLWQTYHPPGSAAATARRGLAGTDLTFPHTYGVAVSADGAIQFYFDGVANGTAIAGGPNATQPMFLNATMSVGGQANDGWAGVPTAATPSPVAMKIAAVRVWTP